MPGFTTTEPICLNADKSKVVPCSSPEAAWQLAGAGGIVSAEDAKKYGLKSPQEAEDEQAREEAPAAETPAPAEEAEPDVKAVEKTDDAIEDKAVHKAENKAAKGKAK